MAQHKLKTVNPHFDDQFRGVKTFDIRLDDRDFQVGDKLKLMEYDKFECIFSGRWVNVAVTHILHEHPSIEPGYVVMSTERRSRCGDDGKIETFLYQTTVKNDDYTLTVDLSGISVAGIEQ